MKYVLRVCVNRAVAKKVFLWLWLPVLVVESSVPDWRASNSRLAWEKAAMYANGVWRI